MFSSPPLCSLRHLDYRVVTTPRVVFIILLFKPPCGFRGISANVVAQSSTTSKQAIKRLKRRKIPLATAMVP